MLKKVKLEETSNEVTRRVFLRNSTHFVVGGCAMALIGCGDSDDEDDGLSPSRPDNTTKTVEQQQPPQQQEPPQQQPPQDEQPPPEEVEEPLAEGAVKMTNALKQVGGNQKVRDREVLDVLDTKETILLVRVDENTVAANTIVCTHQNCSVGYNKNQKRLDCPCHGSRFDLNGKVLRGPAGRPLTHFKATIQGDSVLLEKA